VSVYAVTVVTAPGTDPSLVESEILLAVAPDTYPIDVTSWVDTKWGLVTTRVELEVADDVAEQIRTEAEQAASAAGAVAYAVLRKIRTSTVTRLDTPA